MLRLIRAAVFAALFVHLLSEQARAIAAGEIGSVTVLAEEPLALPLSQLASLFARENMITVTNGFGNSVYQEMRIEDGESADIFITSDAKLLQELRIKGMVDVQSVGRIVSRKDIHYVAGVVAGENMTPARAFLAFLKTDEAKAIWKNNGVGVP